MENAKVNSDKQKKSRLIATAYGAMLCIAYLLIDDKKLQLTILSSMFLAIFSPSLHIFRDSKSSYSLLEKMGHAKLDNLLTLLFLWTIFSTYGHNIGLKWFFASLVPFIVIINFTKGVFWHLSESDLNKEEKGNKGDIELNVPWLSMLIGAIAFGFLIANNNINISLTSLLDGKKSAIAWLPVMIGSLINCTILKILIEYSIPIYEHLKK